MVSSERRNVRRSLRGTRRRMRSQAPFPPRKRVRHQSAEARTQGRPHRAPSAKGPPGHGNVPNRFALIIYDENLCNRNILTRGRISRSAIVLRLGA